MAPKDPKKPRSNPSDAALFRFAVVCCATIRNHHRRQLEFTI